MAVAIADPVAVPTATPRARLLWPLVRHASMPASSQSGRRTPFTNDGHITISTQLSIPSVGTTATSPTSKDGLLSALSVSQALSSRLRRDRESLRSFTKRQHQALLKTQHDLREQAQTISNLKATNTQLRNQHDEDMTVGRMLHSQFNDLIVRHDSLISQHNEARRSIVRLKKSDRSKGKVQQRNLRLKATLQRFGARGESESAEADANTQAALREALALANERVNELESKGEALLEVLERRDDEDKGDSAELRTADLLEARLAFQGELEDETFREQRENWAELLDD